MIELDSATITELAARAVEARKRARRRSSSKKRESYRTSPEKVRKIVELYKKGYRVREIAEMVGVSKSTVSRVVRREGVVRDRYIFRVMGFNNFSVGIVVPKEYVKKLGLRAGDKVSVEITNDGILIKPYSG